MGYGIVLVIILLVLRHYFSFCVISICTDFAMLTVCEIWYWHLSRAEPARLRYRFGDQTFVRTAELWHARVLSTGGILDPF